MNICRKAVFVVVIMWSSSGCAWSSESDISSVTAMGELCKKVMYGKLNLQQIQNMGPLNNSYLFNCAVSVVVPFLDEKYDSVKNRMGKKIEIANYFISQEIDVTFKDESESTLLISVITSYMPTKWKIKFVNILISKGCDIKAKNKYGKSALELAKFTNEAEIINILLEHDATFNE